MNRLTRWALLLVLVAGIGGSSTSTAQEATAQQADTLQKYVVTRGSTMWNLAKSMYGDGEVWRQMFKVNVDAGVMTPADTVRKGGRTYARLEVGQVILLNRLAAAKAAETVEPVASVAAKPDTIVVEKKASSLWMWLAIILALAAILIYATLRNWRSIQKETLEGLNLWYNRTIEARKERDQLQYEANRSPAEKFEQHEIRAMALFPTMIENSYAPDGPSFIQGGIANSDDLALALERSAQIADARRFPDRAPPHHTAYRFKHGERGMVTNGRYRTLFSNGTARDRVVEASKPETHRVVWRATTVSPIDGNEFMVYTEETCANGMGTPIGDHDTLTWVPFPADEQRFSLPQSVMYVEPTPIVESAPEVAETAPEVSDEEATVVYKIRVGDQLIEIHASSGTPVEIEDPSGTIRSISNDQPEEFDDRV